MMRGKRLLAAVCVLILLLTACSQGPETPAEITESNTVVSMETDGTAELTETTSLAPEAANSTTEPQTEAETESAETSSTEALATTATGSPSPAETEAPEPTSPKPTEPKPTTPTPTEPKPTEPKPTEPQKPAEPAHIHSYKAAVVAPSWISTMVPFSWFLALSFMLYSPFSG